MGRRRVQIKVGQTWAHNSLKETYTITGIEGKISNCKSSLPGSPVKYFCIDLDEDGWTWLGDEWSEVTPKKLLPRECKCGIFRGDCTYHKDQQ